MRVKPLRDRILVSRIVDKQETRGGIVIPDTAKEKPMQGKVIAVGTGRLEKGKKIPLEVKAGDRVLFEKFGGTEVKIDDKDLVILREDEVLGIVQ